MVTHFPALEATSFIPECASGSDLRKCRRSLPLGREPQPSLKSGDIYRVASGRDSDAARRGTKRAQILGLAWSSGCCWLDSGQWSRAGQEEGTCLVSPLLLAPCPEAQVGGAAGVWGQLEAPSPPQQWRQGPASRLSWRPWPPSPGIPRHLPTSCWLWLLGRNTSPDVFTGDGITGDLGGQVPVGKGYF